MSEKVKSCCAVKRQKENMLQIQSKELSIGNRAKIENMIYLEGGEFLMGSDSHEAILADAEGPVRKVKVPPFYMDPCTVTNEQFAEFINDTGYKTEAESYGDSFVFHHFVSNKTKGKVKQVVQGAPWWWVVDGANWKNPEGPNSTINNRMDHPVVHVSWNDAMAFCKWSGKRLPTEAEWEYAARGGLIQKTYPWGDELTPNGIHQCNIWQGDFPEKNDGLDGFMGTAPANHFPANNYGLYNMAGNVWEWCLDWFNVTTYQNNQANSSEGTAKVIKGGSYLCHQSYCNRYRVAARTFNTPDSSTGHIGFRCVADV